jgi:hypothetical protein
MNPFLGVFFHWLGGLASGSFYVPYRAVRRWSWETYWLVGGIFSWIIAPWVGALINTTDPVGVLKATPSDTLFWAYLFGLLWGFGGLTFGLTMRYLGMSLGMAVALGYCAAFGTLIPPLFHGEFVAKLIEPLGGKIVLLGVIICLVGIAIAGLAGKTKENEMSEEEKRTTVKEFDFKKGILVATFSGIMSACFAFGLDAGSSIKHRTLLSDYLNSAKAAGLAVETPAPTPADDSQVKLAEALAAIEEPHRLSLDTNSIAEAKSAANAAATAMSEQLVAATDSPLAARLSAYSQQLQSLASSTTASNPDLLATILSHATLELKEASLAINAAGGDLLAIHSKHSLWQNLPVLIVVLLGGFTTNFLWCVMLNLKNGTGYQYFTATPGEKSPPASAVAAGGEGAPADSGAEFDGRLDPTPVPLLRNYFFSALAGITWYFQFFFYSMGETQMGKYAFSSWTLHMASIIIFSSMWGIALHEWRGASSKAWRLLLLGIGVLVISTIVVGLGNYLGASGGH